MICIPSTLEKLMEPYPEEIEQKMLKFYQSLSEKERRPERSDRSYKAWLGGSQLYLQPTRLSCCNGESRARRT